MFCSVKVQILCIFVLISLVHLSNADNDTINVLKRIQKQLSEFKRKYENEQQRIRDLVSLSVRDFQDEPCFNATIGMFMHKNDNDPFGNIHIVIIELDVATLLSDTGKLSESAVGIAEKQGCECEKACEVIRQDVQTNRMNDELKAQFETQKQSCEETNKKLNNSHQIMLDSLSKSLEIRNKLNNLETLTLSQNNSIDELATRLSNELKTQFELQKKSFQYELTAKLKTDVETQNEKIQTNINAKLEQLIDNLERSQNTSQQVRNILDKHIPNIESSLSEQKKLIKMSLPNFCTDCDCAIASGKGPGTYQILIFNKVTTVFCDALGKMMIQHQMAGSEDFFNRTWVDFKNGFGSPHAQYWMGLEYVHLLTSSHRRVDFDDVTTHVIYDDFKIADERDLYRMNKLGEFSGDEDVNKLQSHMNMPFSTFDKYTRVNNFNCARRYDSGWWYFDNHPKNCSFLNLNKRVGKNDNEVTNNVLHWDGKVLKEVSMYIKLHDVKMTLYYFYCIIDKANK